MISVPVGHVGGVHTSHRHASTDRATARGPAGHRRRTHHAPLQSDAAAAGPASPRGPGMAWSATMGGPMSATDALFRYRGRLRRSSFLGFWILLVLIVHGLALLAAGSGHPALSLLALFVALVSLWPATALMTKRLHDMGMGAGHMLWVLGPQAVLLLIPTGSGVELMLMGVSFGAVVAMACKAGQPQENAHGPVPDPTPSSPPFEGRDAGHPAAATRWGP